jgi:hypothetical protein
MELAARVSFFDKNLAGGKGGQLKITSDERTSLDLQVCYDRRSHGIIVQSETVGDIVGFRANPENRRAIRSLCIAYRYEPSRIGHIDEIGALQLLSFISELTANTYLLPLIGPCSGFAWSLTRGDQ